jgi:hypothetical protein
MKDSVTRFNFDDAFKALDEIEIPVAEKGIKANRVDLKESMKKVDKFELLFEDFYDVNNADDMNAVSEEREAEVAKAKLARIEKIVDLDAETEEDILPSYVGKTIIQCPQCMTLFYKNAEDIVKDEENPDVVNVAEVCQHCGNESGYDVIGKVAEETEATPGDELGTDDFSAEVGDGMNDIAIDDGIETTEEASAEGGEVDELSAEADLDSLDLDTEFDLEEEPVEEEEEEANESLNTSKLLKKIEDKNELKTENESEKLTLNEENKRIVTKETDQVCSVIENGKEDYEYFTGTEEECKAWIEKQNKTEAGKLRKWSVKKSAHVPMVESVEDNLDDKLKAHEEYIKELRDTINELEKKLAGTKNEQIKTSIQSRIDAARAELEAALPEAVKAEAQAEELPDATEAGMEDATDNTSDETKETTESLHEAADKKIAFMDLTGSLADCEDTYQKKIEKDGFKGDIRIINDSAMKGLVDAVNSGANVVLYTCDDDYKSNCKEIVDKKNFKVVMITKEALNKSLHEAVESMTDTLNRAWKVAKKTKSPIGVTVVTPAGAGTMGKIKEWSRSVIANLYYVDAKNPDLMANGFDEKMISRPDTIIVIDEFDRASADTQKAISNEIDNLDTQVEMAIVISHDSNINGDNFKRFKQYVATATAEKEIKKPVSEDDKDDDNLFVAPQKATKNEGLTEDVSMTSSPENFKALLNTKEFKEPISQEEVESYFESVDTAEDNKKVEVEVTAKIDGPELTQKDIDTLKGVEDIDEESFNECLTESLKEVYQNVKCFEMTNCTTNGTEIVVEGLIKFNSGKARSTSYIFEAHRLTKSKQLILKGKNKDLFEQGNIKIRSSIINEALQAKALKYKYSIGKNLVEGLIK